MRRSFALAVGLACMATLIVACFGAALFRGEQFAYRDAGHFYYPLYERVEKEWDARRLPLWEMEENAGMPLLGNPTAAVLYPGKLIYRLAPTYAWGARLYVVAHVILAVAGMYDLMRSWGTGRAGSGLAALSYGFGGPVLFQYCNIIFLVGAAWVPFGLRAADRWVRLRRPWAICELAIALALQALGGDPQTAYLTALCGAGYALALSRAGARSPRIGLWVVLTLGLVAAWIALTLLAGYVLPGQRPHQPNLNAPPKVMPWTTWVAPVVLGAWGLGGLLLVLRSLLHRHERRFLAGLVGLGVGAGLALALAAVQLVPVMEFSALSMRAAEEGAHDVFPFSLEPYRVLELAWPNVFGTHFNGHRVWLFLIPPTTQHRVWVASLYQGGLALVLALGAFGFGGEKPWRGWLSAILLVSLVGSFGSFAGPLWVSRTTAEGRAAFGPHDPPDQPGVRFDGKLVDGDGSPYWMLATGVPGFGSFRYPSKLLTFTTAALAGLAGLGWDRAGEGRRKLIVVATTLGLVSLGAWAVASAYSPKIIAFFRSVEKPKSAFGPFDAEGAVADLRGGFAHGAAVFGASLVLVALARRRPRLAGALALGLSTADLVLGNAAMVRTVPQSVFEGTPRVIAEIEKAEKADPSPGPYRVHRMPAWSPLGWFDQVPTTDRVRDFGTWERDTIQPKYGIPLGLEYTLTEGTMELYDYHWFFGPFPRTVDAATAGKLGVRPGEEVVYFPRRGFDLWNTRYFVVPLYPGDWNDAQRGFASFLLDSRRIYPKDDVLDDREAATRWAKSEDVQVYRSSSAFPRAWVVHKAEFVSPITGRSKAERQATMESILFQNDAFWNNPDRRVFDFRDSALIETEDDDAIRSAISHASRDPSESVVVRSYTPQSVELEATLKTPGLVVLADVFYPGWELEIDGKPSPIIRANRLMRGALVPAGTHRMVYRYRPRSLVVGAWMSLAGTIGLIFVGGWAALGRSRSGDGAPS